MANWTFDALAIEPVTKERNEGLECLHRILARRIGDGVWSEDGYSMSDLLRELGIENVKGMRTSTYFNEIKREGDKIHLIAKSSGAPNLLGYELISRCLGLKYVIYSTQHMLGQFINTDLAGEHFSSRYNLSYVGNQNYEHIEGYQDLCFGMQFSSLSDVVHFLRIKAEFSIPTAIEADLDRLTEYLSLSKWNLIRFYSSFTLTREEEMHIQRMVTSFMDKAQEV